MGALPPPTVARLSARLPRSFARSTAFFPSSRVSNVISHFDEFFHIFPCRKKRSRDFRNQRSIDSFENRMRRRANNAFENRSSRLPSMFGGVRDPRLKTTRGIEFTAKTVFSLLCCCCSFSSSSFPASFSRPSITSDRFNCSHTRRPARASGARNSLLFVSICKIAADTERTNYATTAISSEPGTGTLLCPLPPQSVPPPSSTPPIEKVSPQKSDLGSRRRRRRRRRRSRGDRERSEARSYQRSAPMDGRTDADGRRSTEFSRGTGTEERSNHSVA